MNPNMIIQMLQTGNPQAILSNIVSEQAHNNPMMNNVLNMMNANNSKGIEQLARNMCKEKGIDVDSALRNLRNRV